MNLLRERGIVRPFLILLFDVLQLGLLLYLTGGLNNPFALLMLAPVTIAVLPLSVFSIGPLPIRG